MVLPRDPVSELLGDAGRALPAGPSVSPGVAFPPAVPAQGGPPAGPTTPDPSTQIPAELPADVDPDEILDYFFRQHGRAPTSPEMQAIRALPVIQAQLGRRPSKAELMAFTSARNETPRPMQPEFEEVSPSGL